MRYDYGCDTCGAEREEEHSMTAKPRITCECGERMHKIPSLVPVHFKGGGWMTNRLKAKYDESDGTIDLQRP